jgi:hypothetical protein
MSLCLAWYMPLLASRMPPCKGHVEHVERGSLFFCHPNPGATSPVVTAASARPRRKACRKGVMRREGRPRGFLVAGGIEAVSGVLEFMYN